MRLKTHRSHDIPLSSPEEWQFKITLIQVMILCALPVSAYFMIADLISGHRISAITGGLFIVLFIRALFMIHKVREKYRPLQYAIFSRIFFVIFIVANFYDVSLGHRLGIMPQVIMFPFLSLLILGRREGVIWAVAYYLVIGTGAIIQVTTKQIVVDPMTMVVTILYITALIALDTFFLETVRQRGYRQLLDHQKELAESNRELSNATYEAQAANLSKSEFLANMSHELRTPLNHIIGFTELIHDERAGKIGERQKEYLGDVLESSRHLLSLINDILDMSKIEAGKQELSPTTVNVRVLIDQAMRIVREKAKNHSIALSASVSDGLSEILGDHRKLRQILYNLVSNAVKFTSDGGSVTIGAERIDDEVRFSVTDTGIGIEQEDQEKIFQPFNQVDASVSRQHQGTGLGLSLTRTFVELHGGRIWFESEGTGKGSCFYFSIPSQV